MQEVKVNSAACSSLKEHHHCAATIIFGTRLAPGVEETVALRFMTAETAQAFLKNICAVGGTFVAKDQPSQDKEVDAAACSQAPGES